MSATSLGLSVGDNVSVQVSLNPSAATGQNFGGVLFVGDSAVIDVEERFRLYTSSTGVAGDFLTTSPEYLAAAMFFSQSPQPAQLYIGRWARTATAGTLQGGVLSAAQQALANFTAVTSGGLSITINGTTQNVTGLSFAAATNLNGVASDLQTSLNGAATVVWNANTGNFTVESTTTGTGSTITFATSPGSGTDISGLLGLNALSGGYVVAGIAAETPLAALTTLAAMNNGWYQVQFTCATPPTDSQYEALATFIQSASPARILGVTTQEPATLLATSSSDLAAVLQGMTLSRTMTQYSSESPYAISGIQGIASTVDFLGSDTTITLKYKQPAGLTPETLTETQAAVLGGTYGVGGKNCNVYVNYNDNVAFFQQGVMCNGTFFDVIQGSDWLQNYIQTALVNLFLSTGKIPQTDPGMATILAVISGCLSQAVSNGLVAPGVWNGPPIGGIVTGQTLSQGFYLYAPSVNSQPESVRLTRVTPLIQAAVKLAGAFHFANVLMNFNS